MEVYLRYVQIGHLNNPYFFFGGGRRLKAIMAKFLPKPQTVSQVSYLTIYFSFFILISLVPIYLRRTQKACFGFWGVWGTGYAPLALGYYGFNKV